MEDKYDGIRANVTSEDVRELVSSIYGMKVVTIKQLNGYEDQNFHITVDLEVKENGNVDKLDKLGYILKVINALDSAQEQDHIYAVIGLLKHLRSNGFICPQVVPTKSGQLCTQHSLHGPDGNGTRVHCIQMTEYIDGEIAGTELDNEFAYKAGAELAKLHNCMDGFDGRKLHREGFIWNISDLPKLRAYLHVVEDEKRRAIVSEVLDKWESLQHTMSTLPKGPIHSDFNEQNILVRRSGDVTDIVGVIDFQDSDYTCIAFDVGIYIMYMMTCCKTDPIEVGGHCLRGYTDNRKLSQSELDVVYYAAAARFAQSLVYGLHYYNEWQDPYMLVTQTGWIPLEELWKRSSAEVLRCWLKIDT